MSDLLKEMFGTPKPVIAMAHFPALPGTPRYDASRGVEGILDWMRQDVIHLLNGGVDGILFCNEDDRPYSFNADLEAVAVMARVIAELRSDIRVPFGVNVLWDPTASIDLAVATGGQFVREIFSGVYASDYGLWNTNCGQIIRHQYAVHAQHVKLFFNIVPESAVYLAERHVVDIAKSTLFVSNPDALCVSGLTAGAETPFQTLQQVKEAVPETPVFANTGVRVSNVAQMLAIADGAIVGTTFKRDGYIWNEVDVNRVREFMQAAKEARP